MKTPTRMEGLVGTVEQDGLNVTVTAAHACKIREDRVVKRTTTVEHRNATPNTDWFWLGASIAATGAGAVVLADAGRVYTDSRDSRTYNPTGPSGARSWGYGLLATGGVLLTIPVIDVIRANQTEVSEGEVRIEGEPAGDEVPCPDAPVVDAPITLRFEQVKESLGSTNRKGNLDVNLDEVLSRELAIGKAGKAEVLVGDMVVGIVKTKPLVTVREARAWTALPRGRCRNPTSPTDCDEIQGFLQRYPDGAHAAEARQLLQEARPKLETLLEGQAWAAVNVAACTKGKANAPQEIETACAPLQSYLSRFPKGPHADEATKAASIGQRRQTELQARLEQQVKDKELQARKAERDAQEREQRAERRQCEGQCRVICSSRQFRDAGSCFKGCVDSRCNP